MSKIIKSVALHSNPKVIATPQQCIINTSGEIGSQALTKPSSEEGCIKAAEADADIIRSQASLEAARLLDETNQCIEELKASAYNEGYQTGFSQGFSEGQQAGLREMQAQIDEASRKAETIIRDAKYQSNELQYTAERQIIEIAISIARKILKREIEENPMTILPVVKEALQKVMDQDLIVLRVNPEDTEMLKHAQRDLQQIIGGEKQLSIIADQTINPGGCMIDTSCGTVDASIDNQLSVIKLALQGVLT